MTNTNRLPARLIQTVDGFALRSDFAHENIVIAMEVRGYEHVGTVTNTKLRAELQGAPKFRGVNGPMWGGDHIRYECPETTKMCSR